MNLILRINSSPKIPIFLVCFLLLNLRYIEGYLSYKEIVSLGASCSPDDTCSTMRNEIEDQLSEKTCQCGSACFKYGTCCIDSPYIGLAWCHSESYLRSYHKESCTKLMGTKFFIYAVDNCRTSKFIDPQIKELCESDVQNMKDPLTVLPVTSTSSSKTYKNFFCALCNHVADSTDLVFWSIRIQKVGTPARNGEFDRGMVLEHLSYNSMDGEWGLMVKNDTGKKFEAVSIQFDYPSDLREKVNACVPDLISKCHPAWTDNLVRYKCQRYMSMIYATLNTSEDALPFRQRFRNVHCAICNFANYDSENVCRDIIVLLHPAGRKPPALSFTLLLDVNPSDGDKVGEKNICKGREVYDPFFKKCRELVCIKPGYKVENGKCVPS